MQMGSGVTHLGGGASRPPLATSLVVVVQFTFMILLLSKCWKVDTFDLTNALFGNFC